MATPSINNKECFLIHLMDVSWGGLASKQWTISCFSFLPFPFFHASTVLCVKNIPHNTNCGEKKPWHEANHSNGLASTAGVDRNFLLMKRLWRLLSLKQVRSRKTTCPKEHDSALLAFRQFNFDAIISEFIYYFLLPSHRLAWINISWWHHQIRNRKHLPLGGRLATSPQMEGEEGGGNREGDSMNDDF